MTPLSNNPSAGGMASLMSRRRLLQASATGFGWLAASALLASKPRPTDSEIETAMNGNLCRCGTYPRIRMAVRRASQIAANGSKQPTQSAL